MGAVVSRPTGLAAADEVGAGAVAGASIKADLALLEGLYGVEDEQRCDASHGGFPQLGAPRRTGRLRPKKRQQPQG